MKNNWLRTLSSIVDLGSSLKNFLYDQKFLPKVILTVPVVSVGNLTFGGTGKTPIVDLLITEFEKRHKKVGVISRSYKAASKGPVKVDVLQEGAVLLYGDEPVLLAQKHPSAVFYVGRSKSEAAKALVDHEKVDVVIVDDGFQHRRLERQLDLVVVDASEKLETLQPFPAGRGREHHRNLKRASAFLLTKVNLAESDEMDLFLKTQFPSLKVFQFQTAIASIYRFGLMGREVDFKSESHSIPELVIFSGLARPLQFKKMISQHLPKSLINEVVFTDHHNYTTRDIELILKKSQGRQAIYLTTEKDAVKLDKLWPTEYPLYVVRLQTEQKGTNENFFDFIHESLF